MREIIPRLFIGDLSDCRSPRPPGFSVIHGAKAPCHSECCARLWPAASVRDGHQGYFSAREGNELFLNIIDPPTPLFRAEVFRDFLSFAAERWRAGDSLLIHCNQGRSRAPSLALVFLAKCLGAIDATSYDAAWDEFAALLPDYSPGLGIETWLREHWHDVAPLPVPWLPGAAAEAAPVAAAPLLTPTEALASIYHSPFVHFYAGARIRDKEGQVTPMDAHIVPNVFQSRACEAYEWCVANNVPVRLVLGPKPRQSGGSTIAAELCYHHTMRFRCSGMVIGDENSRTDLLWKMFNEMAEDDRFRGIWGARHSWNTEKAKFTYSDADGIERELEWLRDTASDPKAGASGTRQVLWFSEAGRYSKEGKATDTQVISNASSSVPMKPGTMIILESTAEGASGYFFNAVKGAVTLEQRMASEIGNGWIKVFCAWHECPDYAMERDANNAGWFTAPLDDEEKRGVDLYRWTAGQIAWRRSKLAAFDGNLNLFKQEFPSSEEEAFQSSGSPRFSIDGITRLERQALIGHGLAKAGAIEINAGLISFMPAHERPWLWVKEEPMYGSKYILFADCMTGEQSAGSLKRDTHAVGVWRMAYTDANGVTHPTRLAAAIDVTGGCRWDDDTLAERAHWVSRWYGNCIMAVEVNEALGVIRELINRGANLWKRTKADEAAGVVGATLKIPGWKTTGGTSGTRSIVVSELARAIRENTLQVEFQPLVDQLKTFVVHPNGTCAAKSGCFDDFVLAAGIGLACAGAASTMRPPAAVTPSSLPPSEPGGFRGKGGGACG